MAFSLKTCTLALLVVAAFYAQLHEATFVPGSRCLCDQTIKFTPDTIKDFKITEKRPGCEKTEVVVTIEKQDMSKENVCLSLEGKLAKAFMMCWNRINKDESQKMNCLNRRKKAE
uniref:Chemokine interleukin-8-like domain-containing protein n=1 Tax=Myripristis murdjan TaxID=586833 RepID=A0A667XQ02_9TELE